MQLPLDHTSMFSLIVALLGGVALASACGLRAFLPLFALSIATRAGLVHLASQTTWLGSDAALWSLGIATILEVAGDKIPIVDHALDVLGTFVRPAAAAVAGWATFGGVDPSLSAIAAIVLGAGAFGIHALKAKTRLGSTALTLGHANPLLSVGEDVTAAGLSAAAVLAPLLAAILVVAGLIWLVAGRRRGR
jgi:hypothetical protein